MGMTEETGEVDVVQPLAEKKRVKLTEEEKKANKRIRSKKYREENKEKIKEYSKQYRKNNKETVSASEKKSRKKHAIEVKERAKEYYNKNKVRKKEYHKKNSEHFKKYNQEYNKKNKDTRREYMKQYREENKEKIKDMKSKYSKNNKILIKEKQKVWRDKNKEMLKEMRKIYYEENKEKVKEKEKERNKNPKTKIRKSAYSKIYTKINKEILKEKNKERGLNLKIKAFNVLGGCECSICSDKNLDHLTIDHIDEMGFKDKHERGLYGNSLRQAIVNNRLTDKQISNLRVLCWNHNSSRTRKYLDIPSEKQSIRQKHKTKLLKEAYKFFGPCATCGETELKFLTISHVHNDGARRRKNGERTATGLLINFRKQGWPESLKEDFCLECYTCNCSHGNKHRN